MVGCCRWGTLDVPSYDPNDVGAPAPVDGRGRRRGRIRAGSQEEAAPTSHTTRRSPANTKADRATPRRRRPRTVQIRAWSRPIHEGRCHARSKPPAALNEDRARGTRNKQPRPGPSPPPCMDLKGARVTDGASSPLHGKITVERGRGRGHRGSRRRRDPGSLVTASPPVLSVFLSTPGHLTEIP